MAIPGGMGMTSWPELKPMKNNLVNYGVTENGIAIIELCSDSAGEPLTEGKTSVNTYTREMWHDIDDGKFGADAKTGTWFLAIKQVKDDNPKG